MSDADSVAFSILEGLSKQNKIDGQEVQYLKDKYHKLFEQVTAAKSIEQTHTLKSKKLAALILEEKIKLEKCRQEESEMAAAVREEEDVKDALQTEFEIAEQKSTMANFELQELQKLHEELQESLKTMEQENNSLVEPILNGLRGEIAELKQQLVEADVAFSKESAQKEVLLVRIDEMDNMKLAKKSDIEVLQEEYAKFEQVPGRLKRQIESIEKAAQSMEQEHQRLNRKIRYIDNELEKQKKRKSESEKLRKGLAEKLGIHRQTIEQREQDVAIVRINLENEKARAHDLNTLKVELNVKKREIESHARHCGDQLSMSRKEYDQLKRQLKKKRGIADAAKQVIPTLELQLTEQQMFHKTFLDDKAVAKATIDKLKEEVDVHIAQLLQHEAVERGRASDLELVREEVDASESDTIRLMAEQKRQGKLISVLSAQRDIKARDSARVEQKEKEARQYVRMKELMILDLTKRCNEISNRLKEFSALYEVVKNERNKYVNLIQSSTQALAEIREKIRILSNEVEILSNESSTKDKALSKEKVSHQQAQNQRDSLRQDMNKLLSDYRSKQGVVEQQIMEIDKLNAVINTLEKDMLDVKKHYEKAVGERNSTGVQLIERNDELCILYERANQQQEVMKKGEVGLQVKEEELRFVRLQTEELKRQYNAAKKRLPEMDIHKGKIGELETKLVAERRKVDALSNQLEDPQNLERWRPLDGEDPDLEQLVAKIKVLDDRLDMKREQLLEKELVLEEVTSLTERLRGQASSKRDVAKSMADQLNELQARIRDTTKKMLASVSELSMYQATALRLQQEKMRRESVLDEMNWKLEHGECPSEDAAKDWHRAERKRLTMVETQMQKEEAAAAKASAPSNGIIVKTTAEPRPTAYIPDELGIPKPYGLLAPFKPSDQGSSMRHTRIPNPKPVEI